MLTIPSTLDQRIEELRANAMPGYGATEINAQNQISNVSAVITRDYDPTTAPPAYGWQWVNSQSGDTFISNGIAGAGNRVTPGGGDTGLGLYGWNTSIVFTAASQTQVNRAAGAINMPDGTVYSISSGNTGTMAAVTYIYLDITVSTTVLQVTTTSGTAVGLGKIMICVAQNNSVSGKLAIFQAFGTNSQSTFITADNIAANTITANEIAANTITASQISVGYVYAGAIAVSQLTAGTITSKSITLAIAAGTGDAKIQAGKTDFGQDSTAGFILGLDDSDSDKAKFEIGSSATKILKYDGTDLTLIGGIITGGTFQTATSGQRVVITGSNNDITFYNSSGNDCGNIRGTTTSSVRAITVGDGSNTQLVRLRATAGILLDGGVAVFSNTSILGGANNTYDLGSNATRRREIYLGTGITLSSGATITGDLLPDSNNTYDLGSSSSQRWRCIYLGNGSGAGLNLAQTVTTASLSSNRHIDIVVNGTTYKLLLST